MKILITGNMGYVGPGVLRQLRESYPGAFLIGYDSGFFAANLSNASLLPECRADLQYFADVRQLPAGLFAGVDSVVHLAAVSNDPMGNRHEQVTMEINHRASVALAREAKREGVKHFVFASSCSVYGFAEEGARTEASAVQPLTAYARSKVLTERDLGELAGADFTVTCLRFATACGMSARLRLDLVLNDFVAAAIASGEILILSDGTPWRPLIHVGDMARAIDWAVSRDSSVEGPFLVVNAGSDGWNYQVRALAESVATVMPDVRVTVNPAAQPDKRSYRVNFGRFRSLAPDHQPRYGLLDTVRELADGLRGMQFHDPDFRNSRFIRLKMLEALKAEGALTEQLTWTFKPY